MEKRMRAVECVDHRQKNKRKSTDISHLHHIIIHFKSIECNATAEKTGEQKQKRKKANKMQSENAMSTRNRQKQKSKDKNTVELLWADIYQRMRRNK